jgi:hypothetical protein
LGKVKIEKVEAAITRYLPVYSLWALIVTILFPDNVHFQVSQRS